MSRKTVLVLGGTGTTGSRVARRLEERGRTARIGSRSGRPPFDWADSGSWAPVLRGVESAYLVHAPDVGAPGAAEAVRGFAAAALERGVRRLVLLSARGEDRALPTEQALRDSGADWTIVRASWFSQNFSEGPLREPVLAGELAFPAGQVLEPFVDADDIANVVVAALTEDGHRHRVYELTGPRLLSFAEAVAELSKASGHEVRYVPVSDAQYAELQAEYGIPEPEAGFLRELFAQLLDGRNAHLTDDVRRALGRPPRDFTDFVSTAAAAGAWTNG